MMHLVVIRYQWCGEIRLMSMAGSDNMPDDLILGVAIHYAQKDVLNLPSFDDPELFTDFSIVARHNYI